MTIDINFLFGVLFVLVLLLLLSEVGNGIRISNLEKVINELKLQRGENKCHGQRSLN